MVCKNSIRFVVCLLSLSSRKLDAFDVHQKSAVHRSCLMDFRQKRRRLFFAKEQEAWKDKVFVVPLS
jgi:hypothetical protein